MSQNPRSGMTSSEEPGTGPMRRVIGCRLQIAIVLEGRGDRNQIDTSAIEDAVNQQTQTSFDVRQRDARINGDAELLLVSRSSIIDEENLDAGVRVARNELFNQNVGFEVLEWRVEAI